MVKDQYANYVVQKMLDIAEEPMRQRLLSSLRPHVSALRRYTYGKHIISKVERTPGGDDTGDEADAGAAGAEPAAEAAGAGAAGEHAQAPETASAAATAADPAAEGAHEPAAKSEATAADESAQS